MMRLATTDQRRPFHSRTKPALQPLGPTHLTLCSHPQCKKSHATRAALTREGLAHDISLRVAEAPTFCRGSCPHGPYVGLPSLGLFYGGLQSQEAAELVSETCLSGRLLFHRLLISPLTVTDGRIHYSREDEVLVLLEEERCPLEAAAYLFRFNADESCGKCTPCRLGVPNVEILLRRFEKGGASKEDAELINLLVHAMYRDSYCEFAGKVTAPLRLLLEVAPEQIEKHLANGCPRAGSGLGRLGKGGRDGQ
jgi:(2Fe-2S) ferredoxin